MPAWRVCWAELLDARDLVAGIGVIEDQRIAAEHRMFDGDAARRGARLEGRVITIDLPPDLAVRQA